MTPVIQKIRRVPFSIKDNVTPKINDLLAHDITERVEGYGRGHTKAGDIHLCINMRRANDERLREITNSNC